MNCPTSFGFIMEGNMEKKVAEKRIDVLFKEKCKGLTIPNYKLKLKKRHIEILNSDNSVEGDIYYEFFSPRFCELGAITTLDLYGCIDSGVIGKVLNDIASHPMALLDTGLYEFPRSTKYMGGSKFSFYQTDSIEERMDFFIEPIKNDIIPRFDNFLNCKEGLIHDIFSKPKYYQYPYATALVSLYINNKNNINDIIELREKAKKAKLQDIRNATEIEEKVFQYFSKL